MKNKTINITMNKVRLDSIRKAFFQVLTIKQEDKLKPMLIKIYDEINKEYNETTTRNK